MDYRELMNGAGLGDVLIPKKEFIKEHERLVALLNQSDIPALQKEAKEQKAELAEKGGSKGSQYIARMMAEAKLKHATPEVRKADYVKGVTNKLGRYVRGSVMDPEVDEDTRMSRADVFDYNKLASARQSQASENKDGNPYGASPFIMHHFGQAQNKPRETAIQSEQRKLWRKKSAPAGPRAVEEKEEEEEPEEKDSISKRAIAREDFQRRKSDRQSTLEDVRLPESKKRAERRRKQEADKRREDELKQSVTSDLENKRSAEREKEERAEKDYSRRIKQLVKAVLSDKPEPANRPRELPHNKKEWLKHITEDQLRALKEKKKAKPSAPARPRAVEEEEPEGKEDKPSAPKLPKVVADVLAPKPSARDMTAREPQVVSDAIRSASFRDGRPSGLMIGKIEELLKPRKALVKKGESPIRTPAEQRDVDKQLARLVREMDDIGYDPNKLGIKGFNPDKYR